MTLIEQIRDLAAKRGTTPAHMVMVFGNGANPDVELRDLIVAHCGYITDSVIDDILEELEG